MTEYDCLLLEHILWQQPEQANRIADWVLSQLAVDDGIKQVSVLWCWLARQHCCTRAPHIVSVIVLHWSALHAGTVVLHLFCQCW